MVEHQEEVSEGRAAYAAGLEGPSLQRQLVVASLAVGAYGLLLAVYRLGVMAGGPFDLACVLVGLASPACCRHGPARAAACVAWEPGAFG